MSDYWPEPDLAELPLFALPPSPAAAAVRHRESNATKRREKVDSRIALVLSRFQRGPISTFEMERLKVDGDTVHRGQAVIATMRQRGHEIDTVRIDGAPHYVYRGFRPGRIESKPFQDLYYQTQHWRAKAAERKRMDGFRCRQCGSAERVEAHHWRYELFAESVQFDLITLCHSCHQAIHEAASGSSMHFPRFIDEQTRDRILGECKK
jgi:hypothetical protein